MAQVWQRFHGERFGTCSGQSSRIWRLTFQDAKRLAFFTHPKHHRRSGPALKRRAKALLVPESGRCYLREEFGGSRQQVTRFFAVDAFFLKLAMQETGRQVQGGGQALRRSGR